VSDAVIAQGLERRFGSVRALDGFDLTVREGEILGLVGPNGAGKTTFIRVVAGLLTPAAGAIEVLGRAPGREIAPETGYMTQAAALYEDLSLRENLRFFGRIYGLAKDAVPVRTEALLSLVDLSGDADRPVRHLSGGERQLANLICAMVHGPRLLLLDEPTVGIDPTLRRTLWGRFAALRDEGTTIVVTTHVMDEAGHCDRVAFVDAGRVLVTESPGALRAQGDGSLEDAYLALREAAEDRP
jgi:ABC-2 type transport system ATP-binding protein